MSSSDSSPSPPPGVSSSCSPSPPVWCVIPPCPHPPRPRILSIQSSVVFGYVGNKSSVFPLQLLGYDVDPIHSCQLSNHTGYGHWRGAKTPGSELKALIEGMKKLNILPQYYTHLLTGYMSSDDFLTEFSHFLSSPLCSRFLYVCDPVLGDNGALYVPKTFVQIYRDNIIQHAHIITPNQTEAEFLTGLSVRDLSSAYSSCLWLHRERGVPIVVITSIKIDEQPDTIHVMASDINKPGSYLLWSFPRVGGYFSGTGDLTAALIMGWMIKLGGFNDKNTTDRNTAINGDVLEAVVDNTLATVQAVIHRTQAADSSELLLIQAKADIEQPRVTMKAKRITVNQQ